MAEKAKIPADIKKMRFEQAMEELEEIVRQLDNDEQSLDDSVKSWERAMALRLHCENLLSEAKLKVEKIIMKEDGSATSEEFE